MKSDRNPALAPLAGALLAVGTMHGSLAAPTSFSSVTFTMYDPTGAIVGTPDTKVTGSFDITAMTFTLASPTPFFGLNWSTHDGKLYAPGTYTISTADIPGVTCGASFSICAGDGSAAGGAGENVEFVVPPGKVGGHIKFSWGTTDGIDVFMIWDASGISTDFGTSSPAVAADGIPGYKMLDGPFKGYSANFDTTPPITLSADTSVPTTAPASDTGAYSSGDLAASVGSTNGSGLTVADVGADPDVDSQCIGGCFDFKVTGIGVGGTAKVVLLLDSPIPHTDPYHAVHIKYRKKKNGGWVDFDESGGDSVASAPPVSTSPLTCPGPGSFSYTKGLLQGNQCVQLTITDGGPNDADGLANDTIVDPGGVGIGKPIVSTIEDPALGGGLGGGGGAFGIFSLLGLGGLGFFRMRRRH